MVLRFALLLTALSVVLGRMQPGAQGLDVAKGEVVRATEAHPHHVSMPSFTATSVAFLHTATGASLLEKDLESNSHRRLANVEQVTLKFTYEGNVIERVCSKGPSVLGKGLKVKFATAEGIVEKDGAEFDMINYRNGNTVVTYWNNKLHAVLTVGTALLELNKDADSDEWVVLDLSEAAAHVAGTDDKGEDGVRPNAISVAGPYHRQLRSGNALQEESRKLTDGTADSWTDCYEGDNIVRRFGMGLTLGSNLYGHSAVGGTDEGAMIYLQQLVIDANLIYQNQMNIVLTIDDTIIHSSYDQAVPYDQGFGETNCPMSIGNSLDAYSHWGHTDGTTRPSQQGLWAHFDKCADSGTIGLAWMGTLCTFSYTSQGQLNTQVNWHTPHGTWTTFAHETGHNFGADHSFEEGQGSTGGIMDYGDGMLNGIYQFNTQYRKSQVCAEIDANIDCPNFYTFTVVCGDGIVDGDEECECYDQTTECAFCSNCVLEAGVQCSLEARLPGSGSHSSDECCTADGNYVARGGLCGDPRGTDAGYCDSGDCMVTFCASMAQYGVYGFCGFVEGEQCQQKCGTQNEGECTVPPYTLGGVPVSYLDGGTCVTDGGAAGTCVSGACDGVTVPTPEPTPVPTPVPTPEPTPRPTVQTTAHPTSPPGPSLETRFNEYVAITDDRLNTLETDLDEGLTMIDELQAELSEMRSVLKRVQEWKQKVRKGTDKLTTHKIRKYGAQA
jgi:hypothetical protein